MSKNIITPEMVSKLVKECKTHADYLATVQSSIDDGSSSLEAAAKSIWQEMECHGARVAEIFRHNTKMRGGESAPATITNVTMSRPSLSPCSPKMDTPETDAAWTPQKGETNIAWFKRQRATCKKLERQRNKALEYLRIYRDRVPLGHQPHMLAAEVDQFIAENTTEQASPPATTSNQKDH